MSTSYYLGCKAHRRSIGLATVPRRGWIDSSPDEINAFVCNHCTCCGTHPLGQCSLNAATCTMGLRILSEGADDEYEREERS